MKVISVASGLQKKKKKGGKKNNPRDPTFHPLLCLNDSHHLCFHAKSTSTFFHLLRPRKEKKKKKAPSGLDAMQFVPLQ